MGRRFAAVAAWESGNAELSATELAALVRALGCDLHWLLAGNHPPRGHGLSSDRPLVRGPRFRRVTY